MNYFRSFLYLFLLFGFGSAFGQDDPVLFTVDDMPVPVSEFEYIYKKSNGKDADFSKESLEKYLELYQNFKLKIAEAKDKNLHNLPALQKELNGYRKKLASSYLIDKEVTEQLVKEAYQRMQDDVRISHIFFSTKHLRDEADTILVKKRANDILKRLDRGERFEDIAKVVSEDKPSKERGGDIGYFTAIFPSGFYNMEVAAYNTLVGKHSGVIRTVSGYHIIKVTDRRPARGEMEVAQVLFAKEEGKDDAVARRKAEKTLQVIREGKTEFDLAASKFSDDKPSAAKKGYVGFIGINRFEQSFEDAVFAIEKDGELSEVIESSVGFHLIKRISHKKVKSFEEEQKAIRSKLQKDPRFQLAINSFIEKIKRESGFEEHPAVFDGWATSLKDTFVTHRWKPTKENAAATLFTIGQQGRVTLGEFEDYAYHATSKRLRFGQKTKPAKAAKSLYTDFVKEKVMEYAETTLEDKYPDFRNLMREYEEGILLFEVSRMEVWDKASEDSVGLADFYQTIQDDFKWEERAQYVTYTVPEAHKGMMPKIRKLAAKKTPGKLLSKFNKKGKVISMERAKVEKSKADAAVLAVWKPKAMTATKEISGKDGKLLSFQLVEAILPVTNKKLDEARGYAIAKYQDYLEMHWVKTLQANHKVVLNQAVFDALVKP